MLSPCLKLSLGGEDDPLIAFANSLKGDTGNEATAPPAPYSAPWIANNNPTPNSLWDVS